MAAPSDDGASNPLHAPEPARDKPTDPKVSARYSSLSRRDTSPEMELRRALWRMGLRYRVQYKIQGLPRRKIDIAFPGKKVAAQVDGCFWHGCPEHGTMPGRNSEWWLWKIAKNQARDRDTDEKLDALGWTVIHVWEHEDSDDAARRVADSVTTVTKPAKDHRASAEIQA